MQRSNKASVRPVPCILVAAAVATALVSSAALGTITINTVAVGNPGNTADPTTGYGAVGYAYNIGTTEVTNAQYTAFLNMKARTDPHGLYRDEMNSIYGGIVRTGSSGSYQYETIAGLENRPASLVSFWDAARFVNWLHNGQGDGDTETGVYTLGGVTNPVNASVSRNAGWQWAIASENEWYKAAYFQPASLGGDTDNYWLYPTSRNTITTGEANFNSSVANAVAVGSYLPAYRGIYDMAGNVAEWNEAIIGNSRGLRGGGFNSTINLLRATGRSNANPTAESIWHGFRVVQVPSPAAGALLAFGVLGARNRRRSSR